MKRTVLSLILALCMLLTVMLPAAPVFAADAASLEAANTLNKLGLFGGTGTNPDGTPNYALEKSMNRMEAVTMLVRLLGKEQEAKSGTWELPFTDVSDWAKPYVGYAYANGLTTGLTETNFGAGNAVTATQFLTFLLRALGYVSGEDFEWNESFYKTNELYITSYEFNAKNDDQFRRGDAVRFSINALVSLKKEQSVTLLDTLIADGAVSADAVEESGILSAGLMNDQLYRLAQSILVAPATKKKVSGNDGTLMASSVRSVLGQDYDGYRIPTLLLGSPAPSLRALVTVIESYFKECADGNYTDTLSGNRSFMTGSSRMRDTFLFTDHEGFIIGYGHSAEYNKYGIWTAFTVAKLDDPLDAREWIADYVAMIDETYNALAVVTCEPYAEGDKYYYAFSDIPEDAVWIRELEYGFRALPSYSKSSYDHKRTVYNVVQNQNSKNFTRVEVTELYSHDAFYDEKMSGKAYTSFVFYDKDLNPIGQALGVLDVEGVK